VALSYIRRLYAIEHSARDRELTPEQLLVERLDKGKPILDVFKTWLDKKSMHTPPRGLLGKAVTYALNQWDRLIKYVEDPCLRPDNNLAENAIRPFVMGRKNWLFSGNPAGARASAALYSLIETAKASGLEPYKYLRYLFEKLPSAGYTEDYQALLPQNLNQDIISLPA
jgi:transposase